MTKNVLEEILILNFTKRILALASLLVELYA